MRRVVTAQKSGCICRVHRRRTRGVRGGMISPLFLALKVGVVLYLKDTWFALVEFAFSCVCSVLSSARGHSQILSRSRGLVLIYEVYCSRRFRTGYATSVLSDRGCID